MAEVEVAAVEVIASGVGIDGTPWRVQHVAGRSDAVQLVVGEGHGRRLTLARPDAVQLATVLASWVVGVLDRR